MDTNPQAEYTPKTLREAIIFYSDERVCRDLLISIRWPSGRLACPKCGVVDPHWMETVKRFKCNGCRKQFSIKVGTVLEDSSISLTKWFPAFWLLVSAKNGISSCELAKSLGVTQKTAWFMLHRIRHIMQTGTFEKMTGTVEVDETFIGGLEGNKHESKKLKAGRGSVGKTVVAAALERASDERHSHVRTRVIKNTGAASLHGLVKDNVEPGANVYTDAHKGYTGLSAEFVHEFVDHAMEYVRGAVSTNGLENYFSLLKRTVKGTYICPEAYHMAKYIDEQAFRFNTRKASDYDRFISALQLTVGKRLTYQDLRGEFDKYFG